MNEPKRYDVGMRTENNPHGFNHSFPWVYEAEQGRYVEYEEYALLKTEVERLTTLVESNLNQSKLAMAKSDASVRTLEAQVERLTKQNALATPRSLIASQDIKTLREQIGELKLENSQYEEHHKYGQNVITSLREEVENSKRINTDLLVLSNRQANDIRRLTKAGDDVANFLGPCYAVREWNAAKEGKQS
jgi:hypothetical protein